MANQAVIGKMRERIVLQQQSNARNAQTNEKIATWSNYATVWASVKAMPVRKIAEDQFVSVSSARFTIRFRSDVTASMRILHQGRIYNIESTAPLNGAKRFLELQCIEFVGGT